MDACGTIDACGCPGVPPPFTHDLDAVLRHPPNQLLRQRLIIANPQHILRGVVCFQRLAEVLQRRGGRGEAEVGLVHGERIHEPRFDEERVSPLDGFLGLWRGVLEDEMDHAQVRLTGAGDTNSL